jgi:hypothetical protein
MPQLAKGGKYVYGWSLINVNRRIHIPDEAFNEYNFEMSEKVILMSGSKTSGGFIVIKPKAMGASKMGQQIIDSVGYLKKSLSFTTPRSEIIRSGTRLICWTILDKEKKFSLTDELVKLSHLQTVRKLLVARGSGLGPAFIAGGRIYDEALKHEDLSVFS